MEGPTFKFETPAPGVDGEPDLTHLVYLGPSFRGGYASIARNGGGDGECAVKCFEAGEGEAARLEYESLLRLSEAGCAYVPRLYGLGTCRDGDGVERPAIVEGFVEGKTLGDVLERGLLSSDRRVRVIDGQKAAAIALEAAKALGEVSAAGVVHRDLSLRNIMLTDECIVDQLAGGVGLRLVDFGQSTEVGRTVTPADRARMATIPYGAPEMYGGGYYERRNSEKCDTWSLGALICTMVAGEYWPGEIDYLRKGQPLADVDRDKIVEAKRRPIDLEGLLGDANIEVGEVERRLAEIVTACTSFNPDYRPSLEDVIRDLEGLLRPPQPAADTPVVPPPPAIGPDETFRLSEEAIDRGDPDEAVRLLGLAAEQGLAEAQYFLGFMYLSGRVVGRNYAQAKRWLGLAADQGHAKAQFRLGFMYLDGLGVDEDHVEAARLLGLAAGQGHAEAQYELGTMYEDGLGVKKDREEAMRLYRLAADQGNAEAQYCLGFMYLSDRVVGRNYAQAKRWLGLAADQGHAWAQYYLGTMYQDGLGVKKDREEAMRLFNLAADQGNGDARDRLGQMYEQDAKAAHRRRLLHITVEGLKFLVWLILAAIAAFVLGVLLARQSDGLAGSGPITFPQFDLGGLVRDVGFASAGEGTQVADALTVARSNDLGQLDNLTVAEYGDVSMQLLDSSLSPHDRARTDAAGRSDALTYGFEGKIMWLAELEEEVLRNPVYGITVASALRDKSIGGEPLESLNPWMGEMGSLALVDCLTTDVDGNLYVSHEYRLYAVTLCTWLERLTLQGLQTRQTVENWCLSPAAKNSDREGVKADYQYSAEALVLALVDESTAAGEESPFVVGFDVADKRPVFYGDPQSPARAAPRAS